MQTSRIVLKKSEKQSRNFDICMLDRVVNRCAQREDLSNVNIKQGLQSIATILKDFIKRDQIKKADGFSFEEELRSVRGQLQSQYQKIQKKQREIEQKFQKEKKQGKDQILQHQNSMRKLQEKMTKLSREDMQTLKKGIVQIKNKKERSGLGDKEKQMFEKLNNFQVKIKAYEQKIIVLTKRLNILYQDQKKQWLYMVKIKNSLQKQKRPSQQVQRQIQNKFIQKFNKIPINNKLHTFDDIRKLEKIYLYNCQMSSLPYKLCTFVNIKILRLQNLGIRELPCNFNQLSNLTSLWVNQNDLKSVTQSIIELRNIQKLYLDHNPLKQLPKMVYLLKLQNFSIDFSHLPQNSFQWFQFQQLGKHRKLKLEIYYESKVQKSLLEKVNAEAEQRAINVIFSLKKANDS